MKTTSVIRYISLLAGAALLLTPLSHAQGKSGGGGAPAGGPGMQPSLFRAPAPAPPRPAPANRPSSTPPAQADKGMTAAPGHDSAAPAAQNLSASMKEINQTSFEARKDLLKNLDMSDEASRDALKKIQSDARDLRGDARTEFKTALDEVKQRKGEVDTARKAANRADAQAWEKAREALGAAYQNYADAMARLEAKKTATPPKS